MTTRRHPIAWHDWHKYLTLGFEGQTADWIMNNGVDLIASDITRRTGVPLIMSEWSVASSKSAKFTDDTPMKYAKNKITAK